MEKDTEIKIKADMWIKMEIEIEIIWEFKTRLEKKKGLQRKNGN